MKTITSLVMLLLLCSAPACAQDMSSHSNHATSPAADTNETQEWARQRLAKSSRHQEWVKIKNGAREVNSFVVYPEVKNKATAVIVIHEIFGMTDWVQSLTDQLAEAGYIAIAPDPSSNPCITMCDGPIPATTAQSRSSTPVTSTVTP